MTSPNYPVTIERAFPYRTIFRPPLRIPEQPSGKSLGHPPIVGMDWQVDVYKGVSYGEPLPNGRKTAVTIDYPLIPGEDVSMDRQVLVIRDLAAAFLFRSVFSILELD